MSKMIHAAICILSGMIWTAICFFTWANVLFWGFPKTQDDLISMGFSKFDLALREFLFCFIPIAWILVPIIGLVVRHYFKKEEKKKRIRE